jgi:hypothetical protein
LPWSKSGHPHKRQKRDHGESWLKLGKYRLKQTRLSELGI